MTISYPVAKVPITEAQLFISPDGEDRDPDLTSRLDMQAIQTIAAVSYINARDQEKPDWFKNPHRLYCPSCFEKGHLSRHYGVKAHDRRIKMPEGDMLWWHLPDHFAKWPDGPTHADNCEFANRYVTLTREKLDAERTRLDESLHTITIPLNAPVLRPAHKNLSAPPLERHTMTQVAKTEIQRPFPINSISGLATFISHIYSQSALWETVKIDTPKGPTYKNYIS